MATVIEFDRRYRSERLAASDIPHLGTPGWRVVPCDLRPGEYRLRLEVGGRAVPVLKYLQKTFPLYTFRVIESDERPRETP